jgi:hypothetical protein
MVERALFDKLAEELKLGSSKLVDRSTALSLGRLLAARLMLFGEVIYAEDQTQLTMRLIETETGLITVSMTASFGASAEVSDMVDNLAEGLMKKLEEKYPMRGKISLGRDDEVVLNIGERVGVGEGQVFEVLDRDVTLEVTSVQPDTSAARVTAGEGDLEEGQRVQVISEEHQDT